MESLSVAGPIPPVPSRRHPFPKLAAHIAWLHRQLAANLAWLHRHLAVHLTWLHRQLALRLHPFWPHLIYFLFFSFAGSVALRILPTRLSSPTPAYIDLLFMSVSALTVSGLNTVELERFSTSQVMVLSLLMLAGGEVFLSLLTLVARSHKPDAMEPARVDPTADPETALDLGRLDSAAELLQAIRQRCISALVYVVLVYIFAFHVAGAVAMALYLRYVPSARNILKTKGLPLLPFALAVTVSSFANGGIIWTNENMIIFLKNSGLLAIVVVLVFVGNTLYSTSLRATVWAAYRATGREEYRYMLINPGKLSFGHLMPKRTTLLVAASVAAIFAAQLVLFLALEWDKSYLDGLSWVQKVVSGVFQATNSRHCGESSIDVSQVSAAVSVITILVMFLPAYASFQPEETEGAVVIRTSEISDKSCWRWIKVASMPQALYVTIFVLVLCLIERKNMANDPLNFSSLFVAFEVVSAYGNVGYSTGYGCSRQLNPDSACKDLWISLAGKFSNSGKLLIMFVMLFGRLKKFHLQGGRSWRLY